MFVRVIPVPVTDEVSLSFLILIFLSNKQSPESTRTSLFIFLARIFFDLFPIDFFNEKTSSAGALNRSEDISE